MNQNRQIKTTLRFRQWSRKGYAAFASLGQCVTIGQLRKNITERALTKQTEPTLVSDSKKQHGAYATEELLISIGAEPDLAELLLWKGLQKEKTAICQPQGSLLQNTNRGIDALSASCNFIYSSLEGMKCKAHSSHQYLLYTPTL